MCSFTKIKKKSYKHWHLHTFFFMYLHKTFMPTYIYILIKKNFNLIRTFSCLVSVICTPLKGNK